MHKLRMRQTGDTIVEVMIAIVVISTVLVGAFYVSRSSLKHVRDSEEHSQALKLLQGQAELVRALTAGGSTIPAYVTNGSDFCFDSSSVIKSGNCSSGGNVNLTYSTKDTTPASTGTHTFVSTITWNSITGSNAKQQLVYRLILP